MTAYSEKLRDPRWQKKRLFILERDDWTCQRCSGDESTLVVHHRRYLPNTEPWDYPNDLLVTLCEDCHEGERINWPESEKLLLEVLHTIFFAEDVHGLAIGFHHLGQSPECELLSRTLEWVFSSPDIIQDLVGRYNRRNQK